ncbi:hypothetical protein FHX37_0390 [Haloactinospora alba]|uniref:Uncharacterized protein n=1 Tax=Haloactinospora alba TaxID=405555 RepID=A0A543NF95_9ACTN|nr:hypothetical protein FHX37_0390 [Haloactinospora alba]
MAPEEVVEVAGAVVDDDAPEPAPPPGTAMPLPFRVLAATGTLVLVAVLGSPAVAAASDPPPSPEGWEQRTAETSPEGRAPGPGRFDSGDTGLVLLLTGISAVLVLTVLSVRGDGRHADRHPGSSRRRTGGDGSTTNGPPSGPGGGSGDGDGGGGD